MYIRIIEFYFIVEFYYYNILHFYFLIILYLSDIHNIRYIVMSISMQRYEF